MIIKTITKADLKSLIRRIDTYLLHFLENPDSLIVRIFGIYTLKIANQDDYHLIIQPNLVSLSMKYITRTYDLKVFYKFSKYFFYFLSIFFLQNKSK